MSTLYLFRHGHIAAEGILAGQTDLPLSKKGKQQAETWQQQFRGVRFGAAWTSPLARARETADIIIFGNTSRTLPPISVPALTEIHLGKWDGQPKEWIRSSFAEDWALRGKKFFHHAPPGGESVCQLAARVIPVFLTLCEQAVAYENSLIVAHQAVNRVILAHILALPAEDILRIPQPYAACTPIPLPLSAVIVS